MPKMKTKKSAAKRVKKTGSGKIVHHQGGHRHLATKKTTKRKTVVIEKDSAEA